MAPSSPLTGRSQRQEDPPLPSDSEIWSFGCQCLNVLIDGRRMLESREFGEGSARVWIPQEGEHVKHPAYASYDQDPLSQRGHSRRADGDILGPSWRTCWICNTQLYLVSGKARGDPGVVEAWVEVHPSTVLHGKALQDAQALPSLPFSGLSLTLPSGPSTFGRPPLDPAPSIYSPVSSPSPTVPRPRSGNATLIPPVHDPFFLPPPFIPAHPHLRDLCNAAVQHLLERHTQLENEVKEFIAKKAREMSDLEDSARAEVELLWEKYKIGPGAAAGEELTRRRSLSISARPISGGGGAPSPGSISTSPINPILREASLQSPGPSVHGGSLLSASISANQMFAPPPPPVADAVDDSISEAVKTYGKAADQRAVAMSYVFSALDETMANQARTSVRKSRRRSVSAERERERRESDGVEAEAGTGVEGRGGDGVHGKDSWIEQERITAARALESVARHDQDVMEGSTPRAAISKELEERRGSKGKDKARVTFEEPAPPEPEDPPMPDGERDEDDGAYPPDTAEIDYVFDFELDNGGSPRNSPPGPTSAAGDISRTRNIVEANLSTTFAADAPSHRAAWRKMGQKSPLYASIRRRDPTDSDDEDIPGAAGGISKLATSVPVSIALPAQRAVSGFTYEPKTSLSDRQGILVPPLKAAMREQGVGRPGRAAVPSPANAGRRSASVSRERDAARSFRADPGAVFESLADDGESDEDDDEGEEEEGGTLRESRTFMPPHILARKESRETGDVGWRSMADQ